MFFFNTRLAFRSLTKNKVYSFLIIGGFAIGFSVCILIGLFYQNEISVNKDFANHARIYRLIDVTKNRCNINWDLFPILVSDYAEVEDACPLDYETGTTFTIKNELTHNNAGFSHLLTTTNGFFSIFSVDMEESLSDKPFDGNESIVISKEVAQNLFGSQNPLGQQVNIENSFYGTVTGVFDKLPVNSSFQADVILNSENKNFRISNTTINGFRYNPTNLFVMLEEGTDPEIFANKLNQSATLKSLDIDSLATQKLDDIYLSNLTVKSRHAKGNPALLKIFLAIAGLILLLSSINFLNYSVSMQYAKLKEIGVNKTNGASRRDLLHYTYIEITLRILIALILAVIITLLAIPYSNILFGKPLFVDWHDWVSLFPFILIAVSILIMVNSLAPIIIMSKFSIIEFLKGFKGTRNGKQMGKQALLTFQFTTSIALIAIVLIIFKQLSFVKHTELGFDREMLLRIDIPRNFRETGTLMQELSKLSFVEGNAISSGCPGMINHKNGSNTGINSFDLNCIFVGNDYIKTMGMELKDGRDFLQGDLDNGCLINEEAMKRYGWDNIEGKICDLWKEGGYKVVGVLKDFKVESYYQPIEPLAVVFTGASDGNVLSIRLAPGNNGEQIDQIRQIWEEVSPYEPFNFMYYDDLFQSMYEKEEKLASSITFFSLIAIILTCMGILGHIFTTCLNRLKEIGIRKINGASISDILVLLNHDFLVWITLAFVIATPIAYYAMHKWLQNFAYKTTLSWWIFIAAGAMAMVIALLTVSWQSWRAATRNPVEALRYE
jgi:putative ABC transport system permease protein